MKIHKTYRALMFAAALMVLGHSGWHATLARVTPPPAVSAVAECEGDACAQIAVTFDGEKGQYRMQNNSADRWVKVSAANLAAYAEACAAPGTTVPLALKSIVGPHRANYDQAGCGATGGE